MARLRQWCRQIGNESPESSTGSQIAERERWKLQSIHRVALDGLKNAILGAGHECCPTISRACRLQVTQPGCGLSPQTRVSPWLADTRRCNPLRATARPAYRTRPFSHSPVGALI
jgi:hypothetical protein